MFLSADQLLFALADKVEVHSDGEYYKGRVVPGNRISLTKDGVFFNGDQIMTASAFQEALTSQLAKKLNLTGGTLTGPLYYKNTSNQFLRTDNIVTWAITNMDTWVPFFGTFNVCRVQQKNYTGTGAYGEANKKTLTFDFQPKLIIVKRKSYLEKNADGTDKVSGLNEAMMVAFYGTPAAVSSRYFGSGTVYSYQTQLSWSGKSVSWWGASETRHLNVKNSQYHVLAIG